MSAIKVNKVNFTKNTQADLAKQIINPSLKTYETSHLHTAMSSLTSCVFYFGLVLCNSHLKISWCQGTSELTTLVSWRVCFPVQGEPTGTILRKSRTDCQIHLKVPNKVFQPVIFNLPPPKNWHITPVLKHVISYESSGFFHISAASACEKSRLQMQLLTVPEHRVGQGKVEKHAPGGWGQGLHEVVLLLKKSGSPVEMENIPCFIRISYIYICCRISSTIFTDILSLKKLDPNLQDF